MRRPTSWVYKSCCTAVPKNFREGSASAWLSAVRSSANPKYSFLTSQVESYVGKEVILGISPENLLAKMDASNASPDNTINSTVEIIEPLGAEAYLYLTTGKSPFIARVDSHNQIEVNQDIELVFN